MTPPHAALTVTRWFLLSVFVGGMSVGFLTGAPLGSSQLVLFAFAVYAAVGMLVSGRQPQTPIGWLFLTVGALTGMAALAQGGMTHAIAANDPGSWYGVAGAWVDAWFWFPLFAAATLFTVLFYPSGLLGPRWRPVLWVSLLGTAALTALFALQPTLIVGDTPDPPCRSPYVYVPDSQNCQIQVNNPLNPGSVKLTDAAGTAVAIALVATLVVCMVLAVVSAFLRSRRANGVEREQMRWFAFAAAIFFAWVLLDGFLLHTPAPWSDVVFAALIGLIPLSCGLAILRYRLYDIDRIISRTTSYVIVTGLLVATFAVIVALTSSVLGPKNQLGVAVATLVAAALARPVLARVQRVVDRRFDRARYDAQRTIDEFGTRLREEVDPDAVIDDLVDVVRQALQPEHAGMILMVRP